MKAFILGLSLTLVAFMLVLGCTALVLKAPVSVPAVVELEESTPEVRDHCHPFRGEEQDFDSIHVKQGYNSTTTECI